MISDKSLSNRLAGWVQNASQQYRTEGIGRVLARGALGTTGLKITYSALNFITSLLLARWLGVAGFGAFAYALAWVVVLAVPSGLGLDVLLVRQVAAFRVQSAWGRIRVLLTQASALTFVVSLGLAACAWLISDLFSGNGDSQIRLTFWIALLFIPVLNLLRVSQAAMQGLGRAVNGQLPGLLLSPFLFLALLIGLNGLINSGLSAPMAMGLNVIAGVVALGIGLWMLKTQLPKVALDRSSDNTRLWMQSMPPLVLLGVIQILESRVAMLMLGALSGSEAIGIYAVASRAAEYVSFFLLAFLPALAPTIASLHAAKDVIRLQRVITAGARITFALSVPVALGLLLFGYWFLGLYGQAFTGGVTVLAILSVAQLLNVAAGPVGYLLMMTGHESDAAKTVVISLAVNIFLSLTLIPFYGINGAAIADAASLTTWNLSMVYLVYRRIGIHSTAFGKISFRGAH